MDAQPVFASKTRSLIAQSVPSLQRGVCSVELSDATRERLPFPTYSASTASFMSYL